MHYYGKIIAPSGAFSIWQFANWKDFLGCPVSASVRPNPYCCLSIWLTCVALENLSENLNLGPEEVI